MNQAFFEKVNVLCLRCPASWESGDRTAHHNALVGGKPASYHLQGLALDLIYDSEEELVSATSEAIALGFQGVEMDLTNNHLHIDGRKDVWQVVRFMQGGTIVEKDLIVYLTTREQSIKVPPVT